MNLEELVKKFISDVNALGGAASADAPSGPVSRPVNYEESGWSLTGRSRYGAPRSKRVDELTIELISKGYTEIAKKIPAYHCIAFWLNEPFPATIHLNGTKLKDGLTNFGSFAPLLSDFEEQQLSDNIFNAFLFRIPFFIQNARDPALDEYRGEANKAGFEKVRFGDNGWKVNAEITIPGEVSFQEFTRTWDRWSVDYKAEPVPNTVQENHYVYNPWWYGKTDENVGRFWRNWAISVGADIRPA